MKRQYQTAFRLGLIAALTPALVGAQDGGLMPKTPNVLLVVDTSGSMEYTVGVNNTTNKPEFPDCTPGAATSSGDGQPGTGDNDKSRWIDLIEVLTGTINNYRCQAVDRSSGPFLSEYELPGPLNPIDYEYRNPYHRPLSGDCVLGPDKTGATGLADAYNWVDPLQHQYSSSAACAAPGFSQSANGIIDNFGAFVRFGLMTFDTLPDPGTGYNAGMSPNFGTGRDGAWSYVLGMAKKGNPADCDPHDIEVGARNAAALPWEGKLIPFGASNLLQAQNDERHQHIEKVLLTTRPYGATPLAGIMDDARQFLLNDNTDLSNYVGPKADPYVTGGCRKQAVIVLTDGEPNLDLRPECTAAATTAKSGLCPFETPEETARLLFDNDKIRTYVIGFSPTDLTGTGLQCDTLPKADFTSTTGACATATSRELKACCNMHKLALMGGTERAQLASDAAGLRTKMNEILNQVVGTDARSRTRPTWARSIQNVAYTGDAPSASYRFLSGLTVAGLGVWNGKLERQRYMCNATTFVPEPVAVDPTKGDDFAANLNGVDGKASRKFYTFVNSAAGYSSEKSIRPGVSGSDPDGLGVQTGSEVSGTIADFVSNVPSSNMNIDRNESNCLTATDAACRDKVLKWTIGDSDGDTTTVDRCATPGSSNCQLLGDILHSTPRVVDRPDAIIQDDTYDMFASSYRERPQMLYVSSNDGFFHAFKVRSNTTATTDTKVDQRKNNELWSYIPPAVLTRLQDQYPSSHQRLLDGESIVKDVVATTDSGGITRFERAATTAAAAGNGWRTVMVQSFGAGWPGYFALDITDPVAGPKLLWQLTTVATGEPLFGLGGTPLITTVFDGSKEIAVAVLPGGHGGAPASTAGATRAFTGSYSYLPSGFQPRSKVHTYPTSPSVAATATSLTIVRLDTGEILRTFRINDGLEADTLFSNKTTITPLDSPMTGRPVAFPSDVGAVADRIFIGDQDGTLWRVDVSEKNPANWKMELFFDTFTLHGTDADGGAAVGQPISTPPILSVDESGNITVNVSTGDQESIDVPGATNYLWSLTELLQDDGTFNTQVNWYKKWTDGTRVTGPMVLLQSDLYFAAFTPSTTSACGGGTTSIDGLDYVLPADLTKPEDGGYPVKTSTGADFGITGITGAVFGVTIGQQPSCDSDTSDLSSPYLGYGSKPSTRTSPGTLQLMYQTSDVSRQDPTGGQVGAGSINLRRPPSISRISSWAALVD
jgi:type IV pilus assembly protein PilY1